MRKPALSQKSMSQAGTEPKLTPDVHCISAADQTTSLSPSIVPIALLHVRTSDKSDETLVQRGFEQSSQVFECSERSVRDDVSADTHLQHHLDSEKEISNVIPEDFGHSWIPDLSISPEVQEPVCLPSLQLLDPRVSSKSQ